MVLILDGNSEHIAHEIKKICIFGKRLRFETALILNKCLKQIKYQRSLQTCALNSELPYNISAMESTFISMLESDEPGHRKRRKLCFFKICLCRRKRYIFPLNISSYLEGNRLSLITMCTKSLIHLYLLSIL